MGCFCEASQPQRGCDRPVLATLPRLPAGFVLLLPVHWLTHTAASWLPPVLQGHTAGVSASSELASLHCRRVAIAINLRAWPLNAPVAAWHSHLLT